MAIRDEQIDVGEVRLHVTMAGNPKDPAVLLLHGFPQSSRLWRTYLEPLAAKGFHVLAPDMRGYGASDKPHDVASYTSRHLVADQVGLIRATGHERAHVVAHDWGGVVAWHLAAQRPEVVDRLVILNAPHPDRMREVLRGGNAQRRRSWYIFFFQLPFLPERMLTRANAMAKLFYGTCKDKSAFPREEVEAYQRAIEAPGGARGMLAYYRAAMRGLGSRAERKELPAIEAPTLLLWGLEDTALGPELAERLEGRVKDLTVERVAGASHWLADERPELVLERALAFFEPKPR
jgi:pimeloyl-ACP methyl ester carboxylesterase